MKYNYIAFDIDGTLSDSKDACLQALQDTLRTLTGSSPEKEALMFAMGLPGTVTLEQLKLPDVPAALTLWLENLQAYKDSISLFPGVPELLQELKTRGLSMGVVTSQTLQEYEDGFAHTSIAPYFTILVRAGETLKPKPSPMPLLRFMELANCRPSEVLFVGDQKGDLLCARGAGVDFALAGWGNPDRQMDVDYYLEKPEDLLNYL